MSEQHEHSVDSENITIPKWLWVMIGCGVAFAFTHTCMQYITAERVDSLKIRHAQLEDKFERITTEQNRRAAAYESISGIRTDITNIRDLVLEVRDDVLVLKTRNGAAKEQRP
jgi:hypothetical protein